MIEPTVLDYMNAVHKLDRTTFCQRFPLPVLLSTSAMPAAGYQSEPTHVAGRSGNKSTSPSVVSHEAPVITLLSERSPDGDEIVIGRSEECDVVLQDEQISAGHAIFRRIHQNLYTLEDLSSTNGTRINDVDIEPGEQVDLYNGNKIEFGEITFHFYYPGGLYDMIAARRKAPVEM